MKIIKSDYIEGTKAEWNTPAASTYIVNLINTFNDYINQFNSKFQEGVNDFVAGVNELLKNEDAATLSAVDIQELPTLSKTWKGESLNFNIPDNYESFTETHLTKNIENFVSTLGDMQKCIDTAVSNGLASQFCTNLQSSLAALKSSAVEVAQNYNGVAAQRAVNQDTNVTTIKSNT